MMKVVRFGPTLAALLGAGVLSGCSSEVTGPARIDPRADQALRQMSAALSGARSLSFRSAVTMDEVLATGQLAEFSRETRVLLRRPDRLFAEIHSGQDAWLVWYSGSDVTILDKGANTWASVEVPGCIDDMLDDLARKHGLTMPLADLLFADPYKVLTADVLSGEFVGMHQVDEVECAHLLFVQNNVDWQIWIERGEAPVPRKVVIDYKNQPGRPQFAAMLSDWNLSAATVDDQFKPVLPKDAGRVELARMLRAEREAE